MNLHSNLSIGRSTWLSLAFGLFGFGLALPLVCAERRAPTRSPAPRPTPVARTSHGTVRHADTHIVQRPTEVRREPERPAEERHEIAPRTEAVEHRDVEADVHRPHLWDAFAFGRRLAALPLGFLRLQIGAVPYFYCGGLYYQAVDGSYQEVYPPVGAVIPQPPDGSIEVVAGNQTYYYAGGAFYVQQPDGTFTIAPTPLGVVVPELPPGAVQVAVNGTVAYQFNGIYYEPTFVNGVTQYETFLPQ